MANILRLATADNYTFRLKRQSRHVVKICSKDGSSSDADGECPDMVSHQLPSIYRLDTRSLVNLFDSIELNFNDLVQPDTSLHYRDEVSENSRKEGKQLQRMSTCPYDALCSHGDTTAMASNPHLNKNGLLPVVVRNDSTGSSSYSQRNGSDGFSLCSENSSKSSLLANPSPLEVGDKSQFAANTTREPLSKAANGLATAYKDVINTSCSPVSPIFPAMNTHKPLPPGPPLQQRRLSWKPSQLKMPNRCAPKSSVSQLDVSMVRSQDFVSRPLAELAGSSPTLSRGERLGLAMRNSVYQSRSNSTRKLLSTSSQVSQFKNQHAQVLSDSHRKSDGSNKRPESPPTDATDSIIYRIMMNLDRIVDLQSAAMVNKGFKKVFQLHESQLVSRVLYKSSRTAWELRQTMAIKSQLDLFKLAYYRRDATTLATLESLFLNPSGGRPRAETVAINDSPDTAQKLQMNNALWRIWTFCLLFSKHAHGTSSVKSQIEWLNGGRTTRKLNRRSCFGIGNGAGLDTAEIEDMSEMWQCLERLLDGLRGQEDAAHAVGVFENCRISDLQPTTWYLEEWIAYLMTLGPWIILVVSSYKWEQIKALGLTSWTPAPSGQSYQPFLKEAIAQVYQERVHAEAAAKAARFSLPLGLHQAPNRMHGDIRTRESGRLQSLLTDASSQALRIHTTGLQPKRATDTSPAVETMDIKPVERFEIKPDCDPTASVSTGHPFQPTSATADVATYQSLAITSTVSARLGATLFPVSYGTRKPLQPSLPLVQSPLAMHTPQIVDPVDKALAFLVNELGAGEANAKRALAMSDTGSGVDVQKACEILAARTRISDNKHGVLLAELPGNGSSPKVNRKPKDYCDGQCKPQRTVTLTRVPTRSSRRFSGKASRTIMALSTISDEVSEPPSPISLPGTPVSPASTEESTPVARIGDKAWRVLGLEDKDKKTIKLLTENEREKPMPNTLYRALDYGEAKTIRTSMRITRKKSKNDAMWGLGLNMAN